MPAIPYKKTGTKDGTWSASEAEKNLKSVEADLRMCFAWVDPNGNADAKGSYKFPHHFVASDGVVGDASIAACHSAIAVLNGGMGGADIPEGDKQGVYDHVAHHLRDAGIVPAEMKSAPRADHRHAAFSGTHTHSHAAMGSQGGDETHTHEHSHDEDHDHSHHGQEAKSARSLTKGISPLAQFRTASLRKNFYVGSQNRAVAQFEFRTLGSGDLRVSGYAAVFEEPTDIPDFWGSFRERIKTNAFAKTLAEQDDVRFLINHDGLPLARTKSGTLKLSQDTRGLHMEADLDQRSSLVRDLSSAIERGDLDQMSFAFQATRQAWNEDYSERDILEAKLFDVSAVTYPAYEGTSIGMRSAILRAVGPKAMATALQDFRDGKTLSANTMAVLREVLDLVAQADEAVDKAQPMLAELMGVPNPDADDKGSEDDSRSSWLSPTIAAALALAKR